MGLSAEELQSMRKMQQQQEIAKTPAGQMVLKMIDERKEAQRRQEKVLEQFESAAKAPEPIKAEKTDPVLEQLKKWGYV